MRVTIHIGTYKTATSAVQVALARGGKILQEVGAKYAQTGLNDQYMKHLHLFDRVMDDGYNSKRHERHREQDYLGQLRAELETPEVEHLIISEEELSYPSPRIAEYFAPLRAVADIEVVMVVRNQPELLESLYLQFIKERPRRLVATFDEFLDDPEFALRGDFVSLLEPWEEVFDRESITVLDFDVLRKGDDFVAEFAGALGLPRGLESPDHVSNPSISPAAAELIRLIGGSQPSFPRMRFSHLLIESGVGKNTTLLNEERIDRILSDYRKSNKVLDERFGVNLDRDVVPRRRPVEEAERDRQALEAASVVLGLVWDRNKSAMESVDEIRERQEAAMEALHSIFSAEEYEPPEV